MFALFALFAVCAIAEEHKYHPQTKTELKALVEDLSINLGTIDTHKITDMSGLFYRTERKDFSGIETWNVSNVKDMRGMFSYAKSFNQNINAWNVSHVETMRGMFSNAESFNQPLDKWDVSKVRNMEHMFEGAESFNQNINAWNVSHIKDNNMVFMFRFSPLEENPPQWFKK
ncbi:DUF285 domain-containing protein [Campylobacter cuniculorum]|nr:DUF285 domain-containing protein [Campylobacter cuniculorum]